MKLKIDDDKLKKAVKALKAFLEEATFSVTNNGLETHALDASQIAMVQVEIPTDGFVNLQVEDKDKPEVFTIDLEALDSVVSRLSGTINLTIKDNHLLLTDSGHAYSLPLIDHSGPAPKLPSKLEPTARIEVGGSEFKKALKDAGLMSSHIALTAQAGELIVSAEGDKGSAAKRMAGDNRYGGGVKVKLEGDNKAVRAYYPLDYLLDALSGVESYGEIKVGFASNAPISISYFLGYNKARDGSVSYWVAPRVSEDDADEHLAVKELPPKEEEEAEDEDDLDEEEDDDGVDKVVGRRKPRVVEDAGLDQEKPEPPMSEEERAMSGEDGEEECEEVEE